MRCCRTLTTTLVSVALVAAWAPAATAETRGTDRPPAAAQRLARQVLPAGDGWASAGTGTTGGAQADRRDVVTVDTRAELLAAAAGDQPKIILVRGRIDANTDDRGRRLECADYARDGYTLPGYLAAFDPATWGRDAEPTGPLEDARRASAAAQAAQITIPVGSNTTIVGLPGAEVTGANLRVNNESNVIIRGLTLTDAYDCFPAWDPTDGDTGNWNSAYDLVSLTGATNVWVDRNDLSDGDNLDRTQPVYFDRPYQVHDGALDITNASDLVTVSYNRFHDHDKTMLIGSGDSRTTDRGRLRVTIHHNEFRDLGQRVPRVRFGQVDVYNNHYVETTRGDDYAYVYSWGVGVESHLVAERNYLTLSPSVDRGRVIGRYNGSSLTENGNLVNGEPVDLLAAYNAAHDPDLAEVEPWAPLLRRTVHPAASVPRVVAAQAGPRRLHHRQAERIVVDRRGRGDTTTVQAAVELAPTAAVDPVEILIRPGTYHERVTVGADRPNLSFRGATGNPRDVTISYDRAAGSARPGGGTWGTTGSASVTLAGAGFTARGVTFANTFDEAAHPEITSRQAVAVKTTADRMVFERCRFLGNQDTLYLDSPAVDVPARVYVRDSEITGDVDFVFGRATAVVDRSTIRALPRDSTPNGYVTAPSTSRGNPYGFLVTRSRLVSDAGPGTYYLGRPWHPSSNPDNDPQVVVRESYLGRHVITPDPWTTMSGYDWVPGRYGEYRNVGPGAIVTPDRPQLSRSEAARYEARDYLAGDDGWDPVRG